jgi:N-acetylglutamate synthase-like GNAT family acetyltransferase
MIRAAAPHDCAHIAVLLSELGYPATEEFVRDRLAAISPRPDAKVLVADLDTEVVGLVCLQIIPLFHLAEPLGRMTTLVISSKFQRYGIGRRLIAEAEMLAWEHGCGRIEITSGDQRGDAHAFYEAVGYEQVSRRFIKFRPLSAD